MATDHEVPVSGPICFEGAETRGDRILVPGRVGYRTPMPILARDPDPDDVYVMRQVGRIDDVTVVDGVAVGVGVISAGVAAKHLLGLVPVAVDMSVIDDEIETREDGTPIAHISGTVAAVRVSRFVDTEWPGAILHCGDVQGPTDASDDAGRIEV